MPLIPSQTKNLKSNKFLFNFRSLNEFDRLIDLYPSKVTDHYSRKPEDKYGFNYCPENVEEAERQEEQKYTR